MTPPRILFLVAFALLPLSFSSASSHHFSSLASSSSSSSCGVSCSSSLCGLTGTFPSQPECSLYLSMESTFFGIVLDSNCYTKVTNIVCNYMKANIEYYGNACKTGNVTNGPTGMQYPRMAPMCAHQCESLAQCTYGSSALNSSFCPYVSSSSPSCVTYGITQNFTVPIPSRACPPAVSEDATPTDPGQIFVAELGAYGILMAQNLSGITPPKLVSLPDRSFLSIYPAKCNDFTFATNALWRMDLFWILSALDGLLVIIFIIRRNRSPIKYRNLFLSVSMGLISWLSLFWLFNAVWWGSTTRCFIILVSGFIFLPIWTFLPFLSACRLVFLYNWSVSKLKRKSLLKDDWYFQHRYMLSTWFHALCIVGMLCVSMIIMLPIYFTYIDQFDAGQSALKSGRCQWYEFTPSMVQAASQYGVGMGPTPINPSGYLPLPGETNGYFPKFDSCTFCYVSDGITTVMVIWVSSFAVLLMIAVYYLRNLNDQYGLWRECMMNCVMLIILIAVTVPPFYRNIQPTYFYDVNNFKVSIIEILQSAGVLFYQFATLVYPIYLSGFLGLNRSYLSSLRAKGNRDSKISGNAPSTDKMNDKERAGTQVNPNNAFNCNSVNSLLPTDDKIRLEHALERIELLESFRQFSVECFAVENIEFFIAAHIFKCMEEGAERDAHGMFIFQNFIKDDALMQVNISGPEQRELYVTFEQRLQAMEGRLSNENLPHMSGREFDNAIKTIKNLINTNTWPKYVKSSMYQSFKQQYNDYVYNNLNGIPNNERNQSNMNLLNTVTRGSSSTPVIGPTMPLSPAKSLSSVSVGGGGSAAGETLGLGLTRSNSGKHTYGITATIDENDRGDEDEGNTNRYERSKSVSVNDIRVTSRMSSAVTDSHSNINNTFNSSRPPHLDSTIISNTSASQNLVFQELLNTNIDNNDSSRANVNLELSPITPISPSHPARDSLNITTHNQGSANNDSNDD